MSAVRPPIHPMPTQAEVAKLTSFLAANVYISTDDGQHEKAAGYQAMLNTVKALIKRANHQSNANEETS